GQSLLVGARTEGLDHERGPLRPERRPDELDSGFCGRPSTLRAVAAMAGAHDIFPHRRASLRARDHVVEVQLGAREAPPTVLAAVVVACVDVEAAESYV